MVALDLELTLDLIAEDLPAARRQAQGLGLPPGSGKASAPSISTSPTPRRTARTISSACAATDMTNRRPASSLSILRLLRKRGLSGGHVLSALATRAGIMVRLSTARLASGSITSTPVLATWVICSQNRRFQNDLTSDKHPRKPTHKVRKIRKDAREFRS